MAQTTDVGVRINAEDNATQTLGRIGTAIKGLEPAFKTAAIAGGAAFAAIGAELYVASNAARESIEVHKQLGAVLQSTGGIAGVTAEMADKLANSLQDVTNFDNDTVLSAENVLLTFTKISKDIFPQTTEAVLDMSTALHQDLQSSAIQLGKALQDPVLGVTALRRVGVAFTQDQQDFIKSLVDTGQSAKAQAMILKEIQTEFGGSARAVADPLIQLQNSIGDLQKEIGKALIPIIADLVAKVKPVVEKIMEWVEAHPRLTAGILILAGAVAGIIALFGTLGLVLVGLTPLLGLVGGSFLALFGWMLLIPIAIAAVLAAGYELYTHWDQIASFAVEVWNTVVDAVSNAMLAAAGFISSVGAAIASGWNSFVNTLSAAWSAVWDVISTIVVDTLALILGAILTWLNFLFPNWQAGLTQLFDSAVQIFSAIYTKVSEIWTATIDIVSSLMVDGFNFISGKFAILRDGIVAIMKAISDVWKQVWGGVSSYFTGVWDTIKSTLQAAVDFVAKQIERLQALMAPVTGTIKSIGGAIGSGFSSVLNTGKAALGIHDGIVQNGQIISTDPADTIIAMKNPGALGGGGINIQISGAVLTQEAARVIGDMIVGELRLNMKY